MAAITGGPVDGVAVVATATYVPDRGMRQVTNAEVDAVVTRHGGRPMSPEWIDRMGVARRWWSATPGEAAPADAATTDELLAGAAAAAVESAGIDRGDVDLFVAATTTTSRLTTSMASVAAGALGMQCAAFELRAGCASAAVAIATAYAQLAVGASCAVVAAAETLSKVAPGAGPLPYVAADAAAAVVLVRSDEAGRGLVGSWISGDGSASSLAGAPGALPPRRDDLDDDRYRLVADRRCDEAAAPWWSDGPTNVRDATGVAPGDVSAFVANQASRERIRGAAASAGVAAGAVVDVVAETANAGCASQLVAFDVARRDGRAETGRTVLLSAVGGGLNAAALLLRP